MRFNHRVVALILLLPCICSTAALAGASLTFDQRVEAQRAIEQVYWRHRLWPAANARPKPSLAEVIPDAALRAKVEDGLKKSSALEELWQRPITTQQLQAEMARMARNTRDPGMLHELFAALGDDPTLIAETLVRPRLADRLLRSWSGDDATRPFEAWWNTKRTELEARLPETTDAFAPVPLVPSACVVDTWSQFSDDLPEKRFSHSVVWTGSEMIVWGGSDGGVLLDSGSRYDPATDTWSATSRVDAPSPRESHTAIWTGTQMIVWGGFRGDNAGLNTGGRYDPASDTWVATPTAGAPVARGRHTAVWTGLMMVVWGGGGDSVAGPVLSTGGRYLASSNSWLPMSASGQPTTRENYTAVWTGTYMVIWGGYISGSTENTGGRYNPTTDVWGTTNTTGAPMARSRHVAVWSGSEMIVWGGYGNFDSFPVSGGRYNPTSNTWTPTSTAGTPNGRHNAGSVWTGSEMIVWGGNFANPPNSGGRYNPASNSWTPVSLTGAPAAGNGVPIWSGTEMIVWTGAGGSSAGGRYDPALDSWIPISSAGVPDATTSHTAIWTGAEMIVWGGGNNIGGRYDPATDDWVRTSLVAAPTGRSEHTAVWTGKEMIVWGGSVTNGATSGATATGGRYDPMTDAWLPTPTVGAPAARENHTAVWTGAAMIVWGGRAVPSYLQSGGRYDPLTDTWTATALSNAPSPRSLHTSVWTGSEMIVWGGGDDAVSFNTGGRYSPATDTWTPTLTGAGCPSARRGHTAVWTGTAMIIWGSPDISGSRYYPATNSWLGTSTNAGVPAARSWHSAIWTGKEMIVWGGYIGQDFTQTGARYDPAQDTDFWTPTSMTNAPSARTSHTAVWTGSSMLVWGGTTTNRDVAAYCAPGGCAGILCDDGNECTDDTCDASSFTCVFSPAPGSCDDADPCTSSDHCSAGVCAGTPSGSAPGEVGASVRLEGAQPATEIRWSAAPFAATHDVVRGVVSGLPVGSGSEACLADGAKIAVAVDAELPSTGVAFWYLVRGQNACGVGGYGSEAHNGTPTTARVSGACP